MSTPDRAVPDASDLPHFRVCVGPGISGEGPGAERAAPNSSPTAGPVGLFLQPPDKNTRGPDIDPLAIHQIQGACHVHLFGIDNLESSRHGYT